MSEPGDMTEAEREPFDVYYTREIAPALEGREEVRRRAVRWHNIILGGGIALALVVVALVINGGGGAAFFFPILIGVAAFGGSRFVISSTASEVKNDLLPRVAKYAGVSFSRNVIAPASMPDFREHRLIPSYVRSSFEDLIEGEAAGCPFELYEAHLKQRHTDSKGRTSYTTVFRGQLLRVQAPQQFLGRTIILRDAGIFNAFLKPAKDMKRIGLVDPKFEKVFEVFGTDQVEARYLLTPDFMERLLELETTLDGKKARAAFAGGELLIAIEGGNLFEAGSMFTPLADPSRAQRVLDELNLVGEIVEALLAAKAHMPGDGMGRST